MRALDGATPGQHDKEGEEGRWRTAGRSLSFDVQISLGFARSLSNLLTSSSDRSEKMGLWVLATEKN